MKPHAIARPGPGRVRSWTLAALLLIPLLAPACQQRPSYTTDHPILQKPVGELTDEEIAVMVATVNTNYGTFRFQLQPDWAPKTCRHFIRLVKMGYYNGLQFHEVRAGTWIRAGDPDLSPVPAPTEAMPVEYPRGLRQVLHQKGAVGLYHPDHRPDEGGKEFYVMLRKYPEMDGGYTAFGMVIEGMDVVDRIGALVTTPPGGEPRPYRPLTPVRIERLRLEVKK